MTFVEVVKLGLKNWNCYSGRTSRLEFLYFYLFLNFVISLSIILLLCIMMVIINNFISEEFSFVSLIFAVVFGIIREYMNYPIIVRRLHDANLSGWWALINLIPIINLLLLLVLIIKKSSPSNKFGESRNIIG